MNTNLWNGSGVFPTPVRGLLDQHMTRDTDVFCIGSIARVISANTPNKSLLRPTSVNQAKYLIADSPVTRIGCTSDLRNSTREFDT